MRIQDAWRADYIQNTIKNLWLLMGAVGFILLMLCDVAIF